MRVRYTLRASRDLAAILLYLAKHSPQGMRNVKRAIDNTERLIEQFPEGGRRSKETGTHVLPAGRYPYLMYWTIEKRPGSFTSVMDGVSRGEASDRPRSRSASRDVIGASTTI
jgi:plasmid stabilization system protein ParE